MSSGLDSSLGAMLLGILFSTVLYGVVTIQVYTYYSVSTAPTRGSSNKDPIWIRSLVAFVWFFETLHTACVWAYIYRLSVTNYNNPPGLLKGGWDFAVGVFSHGTLSVTVQWFFCFRIYIMSSSSWPSTLPGIFLSLLRWTVELYVTDISWKTPTVAVFSQEKKWTAFLAIGSSFAADAWITAALVYYMRRRRSEFVNTTQIVDKLVRWTVETGGVTTFLAALILIFVTIFPDKQIWLGILFVYAKIYSNALMASLNSRRQLRRRDNFGGTTSIGPTGTGNHSTANNNTTNVLSIRVDQTVHTTATTNGGYELDDFDRISRAEEGLADSKGVAINMADDEDGHDKLAMDLNPHHI